MEEGRMETHGQDLAILVNGEPYRAPVGSSALEIVAALGLAGRPLAVEVNEQVVPRARLAACMLTAGDRIEIVTLVGGG
jgi:sulfur carrier protein